MRKLLFALLAGAAQVVCAQGGFPSKLVTLVVGFAPGGGTDTVARLLQPKLSEALGQQVVVDNKAGAGGAIATDFVARAAPDGHTILLGNIGSLTVAPYTIAKLPYDPLKDLAPITMSVVFANVIAVHADVPAKTLGDLVKMAREKPGTVTYGSSGVNGAAHLAGEMLKVMSKADIVHVPYKGGGPALQALLGKQTVAAILTPVSALPHMKAGTIRALATTGSKRAALIPEVPTVAEQGYAGYEAINWYAFMAPAKTPREVIQRLNRDLVHVMGLPDVREAFNKQGLEPSPGTPEELARYMQREYETWGRIVKEAGIKAQ
ncbi:MAG: Bug family tripartite tricarboxylate transporter substrate binding protein [Betaproteobacteria bacterium]